MSEKSIEERLESNPEFKKRWTLMTTSPELNAEQEKFLSTYLDSLDYGKIDVKKLLRDLITTQVLRDPHSPHGGKYDIWCGHNRTLSYALEEAEKGYDILSIFDIVPRASKKEEKE